MEVADLPRELVSLKSALTSAVKNNVDINKTFEKPMTVTDFKKTKHQSMVNTIRYHIKNLQNLQSNIQDLKEYNKHAAADIDFLKSKISSLKLENAVDLISDINSLITISSKLTFPEKPKSIITKPVRIPIQIRDEVLADIEELDKCFSAGCYRSCIILCGRLLETGLHSKYYDVTGTDLLEKSPGIGLGNLIAKMKAKHIELEPGLTHQIHLINNVRIFSVHKKTVLFKPSRKQTEAIVLYTMDALQKLFS